VAGSPSNLEVARDSVLVMVSVPLVLFSATSRMAYDCSGIVPLVSAGCIVVELMEEDTGRGAA
jgi:hypothetical protein